jgi:hypothetical protein
MSVSKVPLAAPVSGWRAAAAAVAVLALTTALVRGAAAERLGAATSAGVAWSDRGMHVVGGPVAASGRVLVIVSAPDHSVWLEAIRPANGAVAWKVRYGFSAITAAAAANPLAAAGIAFALVPVSPASSIVQLEGIRIATGKAVWHGPAVAIVTDIPTACPGEAGNAYFCLTVVTSATRTNLVVLSARDGKVLASVPDVTRLMSDPIAPALYEWAGKQPALLQITFPGGLRWKVPFSRLFGADHDPDFGWDFTQVGGIGVGSLGQVIPGVTAKTKVLDAPLGGYETAGFSETTGKLLWRRPGLFQCGDALGLPTAFLCVLSGSAIETAAEGFTPTKGSTLTIEGLDLATGAITWRHRVGDIGQFVQGDVALADDDHVVVHVGARLRVLDLATGALAKPAAGQVFWCGQANSFVLAPPTGLSDLYRQGQTLFAPCSASMHPLSPASLQSAPSVAATTIDGMAVWAGGGGLSGAHLGPKQTLVPGIAA